MKSTERAILALRNTLKEIDKDRLDAIIRKVDQIEIEENSPTIFEYLREMAEQIWTYRILEAKDTSICPN
uniref:hypothetical protein n=1 Tax=Flavobacterium filum TaxID=370974 RepID=UPI0023F4CBCF